MSVKGCSKALFGGSVGYGESPCFSRSCLSWSVDVDCLGVELHGVDVGESWECAG